MLGLLVSHFALYQISSIHHPQWFPLQDYPRPASFTEQKLRASELHAWSGLTSALCNLSGMMGLCDLWASWQCISVAASCRSSSRNASFVQNCPMDGVWGLQTATDPCSSVRNLEQASSECFALNISECSCGFVQAGIADSLLEQLWPTAACPTQHIPEQGWVS